MSSHCLKILNPPSLAAAIIGHGGANIDGIRKSTKAALGLSDKSDLYPDTECRLLTCGAENTETLDEVARLVIEKLAEVAAATPADAVGFDEELKLAVIMPKAAVGGLIGKAGKNIAQLRKTTAAKITIQEPYTNGPDADQVVTTVGSAEALNQVVAEVNKQVSIVKDEGWFSAWAAERTRGSWQRSSAYSSSYDYWDKRGDNWSYDNSGYGSSSYDSRRSGGRQRRREHGVDELVRVAEELPEYVLTDSRGFAMSCVVPSSLVGGLIGKGGQGTKEVQKQTNTKIAIRDVPGDPSNKQLNISGPLPMTVAAYMLMMKRYLDSEANAASGGDTGEAEDDTTYTDYKDYKEEEEDYQDYGRASRSSDYKDYSKSSRSQGSWKNRR